jgi:ATP-dependent Clp endopeptidase proteolytic subunit ClpP
MTDTLSPDDQLKLAQAEKFKAEADKLLAEASKNQYEAVRAAAEAKAAELAAEQVTISTEREHWKRAVEMCADAHHGVYRLSGTIEPGSVGKAVDSITVWRRLNPEAKDYKFVINSQGGSVVDGVALFDTLRSLSSSGVHVTTVATGMAASMGAILTQAGDTRIIMPNASFMLHEAAFSTGGKTSEVEDRTEWVRMVEKRFAHIIAQRSKLSERQLSAKWSRKDWWMMADEALDLQFFDRAGDAADLL